MAARRPTNSSTLDPAAKRRPVCSFRRETLAARAARGEQIVNRLAVAYPQAVCSLDFKSPFQLIVATILSAQCTDKRVNMVTGHLFERWPTPAAMAASNAGEIEAVIHSTGFFRAKAKNIRGCCTTLVEQHAGKVPQTLAELILLPGVGRKTANVVLGCAFGRAEGVVVDTHVGRIARRLGLTRHSDAVRAEQDLIRAIPKPEWIALSHRLIAHGRTLCQSRKPRCDACVLVDICPRLGVDVPAQKKN